MRKPWETSVDSRRPLKAGEKESQAEGRYEVSLHWADPENSWNAK
jgi:hypothetical protein